MCRPIWGKLLRDRISILEPAFIRRKRIVANLSVSTSWIRSLPQGAYYPHEIVPMRRQAASGASTESD